MSTQPDTATQPQPQPAGPLALEPGMEFKLGDRLVGTGDCNMDETSYYCIGDEIRTLDKWLLVEGDLSRWMNTFLSHGKNAARCEWKSPRWTTEGFSIRLTWHRDAPLEVEVFSLGAYGEETDTPADWHRAHILEEIWKQLGELPYPIGTLRPYSVGTPQVPLLTAMLIANALQDGDSNWVEA